MMISENKSYKIQLLRGVAIIAVVVIHNTPVGFSQVFIRPFFNFAVGMFLFLSGMLSSSNNWKPWKRIKKVIFPYFIWTLIYVIESNIKSPANIPISYIKMLLTGQASAVMYYVFVYCELTLLIPLIDKLSKSRFRILGFLISPIEILVIRLIPLIAGIEVNNFVNIVVSISFLGWFTYFYLGYLLGNDYISVNFSTAKLVVLWCVGIVLQVVEGFLYYALGNPNCGTQLKLSSVFSGVFFVLIAHRYINSEKNFNFKWLQLLGNYSFGLFYAHLAVQGVLGIIPFYRRFSIFPLNSIVVIFITSAVVALGRKILGKNAKYFAF